MERIKEELQCCESLLPINDRAFLHCPHRVLHLLEHDCAKKVGRVIGMGLEQKPVGDAYNIAPEGLPLILFVPDVGALEQGNHKPLRMHEDGLRCADLSFQGEETPSGAMGLKVIGKRRGGLPPPMV